MTRDEAIKLIISIWDLNEVAGNQSQLAACYEQQMEAMAALLSPSEMDRYFPQSNVRVTPNEQAQLDNEEFGGTVMD